VAGLRCLLRALESDAASAKRWLRCDFGLRPIRCRGQAGWPRAIACLPAHLLALAQLGLFGPDSATSKWLWFNQHQPFIRRVRTGTMSVITGWFGIRARLNRLAAGWSKFPHGITS